MIEAYYRLTKPGIIRANVMTAIAGYLFAAHKSIHLGTLLALAAGVALVIASACVINNYIDRSIDKKMARTKNRALVTGKISVGAAWAFALCLGTAGFGILAAHTNRLSVLLGVLAVFSYVVVYGYAKRKSPWGTLVGTVPGALSLTTGYIAVAGTFDTAALLLFLIMVCWQMPHFYAIAIFRRGEYKAAGVPILSVVHGVERTKKSILVYAFAYLVTVNSLTVFGYTGWVYSLIMTILGLWWVKLGAAGLHTSDNEKWARKMFGFSLLVLLVFCVLISLTSLLP